MQTMEDLPGTVAMRAVPTQYLRILCACAMSLTFFAAVFFLFWLQGVLVPLTFAVFLALLCEPLLRAIVLAPDALLHWACHRCCLSSGSRSQVALPLGAVPAPARRVVRRWWRPGKWLQHVWDFMAVVGCWLAVFGPLTGIIYAVIAVVTSFNWDQYEKSPKWDELKDWLEKAGIIKPDQSFDPASIWNTFKTELLSAAFSVIKFSESMLITVLIYLFCLLAMLPGIHERARSSKDVRWLVQQYLIRKTAASLIIAVLVAIALALMHVPLVIFFGVLTFFLNFIPNLGSLIAILFPVPLVWLAPGGSLLRAVLVVVVQFLVHNLAGQLIEPWIMSQGLDLHPLAIIIALTFWGSIWGIAGTVLSVPLTCVLRLWLGSVDHPLARHVHALFEDPLTPMPANYGLATGPRLSSEPSEALSRQHTEPRSSGGEPHRPLQVAVMGEAKSWPLLLQGKGGQTLAADT